MRRNEQIRISPLRVIAEDGEQLGVMSNDDAQRTAREAGLDLVEVASNVRPPVCRIMDYGKWKYLQKKKAKKSHEQLLKEVRLRPRTDEHDLGIKIKNAQSFFEKGAKVQFTMRFRGRECADRQRAMDTLRQIAEAFDIRVKVERPPSMDGRNMIMILSPIKGAFDKASDEKPAPSQPRKGESSPPPPATDEDAVAAMAPATTEPAAENA